MALELLHGVALVSIVAEKASDEVLEVSREPITVDLLEVGVHLSSHEEVVEELFLACLLERENTLYDNEKDDSHREEVHLSAVVGFAFLDFRSHVGHGATVGLQVLDALVASETEVSNF